MLDHPSYPDPFLTKSPRSIGFYAAAVVAEQAVAPSKPVLPVKQGGADACRCLPGRFLRGHIARKQP